MSTPSHSLGQKIELNDGRVGIIRFLGNTAFQTGEWVGIELEEASGKNDGSVQGQRYFDCPPKYGIFCRPSGINHVLEEPRPKAKPASNGEVTKSRPSGVGATANATRRQTLQGGPARTGTAAANTPTPASRLASGIQSPAKSPTKQLGTNGTSSTATSRTSTPPAGPGKRPVSGVNARSRQIMAPSTTTTNRRTSTLPPASTSSNPRLSRPSLAPPSANSRASATRGIQSNKAPTNTAPTAKSQLRTTQSSTSAEPTDEDENEQPEQSSAREDTESSAASQSDVNGDRTDEDETVKPNFAPPSMPRAPPIPPEPSERRARRPSSPGAASVHSQKTIRSTAASNRQIEELEAKVRLLERKRLEDRELKQNLDQAQQERNQFKGIIEKLQTKYRPQQQEMERLKRELAEYEKRFTSIEDLQAQHDHDMELALLDREVAEETAEGLRADLTVLRANNEEMSLELEVLREENGELGREMSPEERTSAGWLQLERSNDRLKEALLSLRDMTQDKEAELKEQIGGLQDQIKEAESLKAELEETKEKLLRNESDTDDLRQQLEVALNAEEMIESLTEDNMNMRDKMNELRATIEDLESLKELNDELEINHIEAEKQLQEEIDFKDSLLLDRERSAKEQQAALDEADYNIGRFRTLVTQLQSDLQDLEASKQISETEAAQLSTKSRDMLDLNMKLQSSVSKTQIKTIDLELRKLEAQEASQHLAIVQLFLPEAFNAERDSVLALLRFRRIGFKANLVQSMTKERISSFGVRGQDEDIFAACTALERLTWIAAMSDRFLNSISGCSVEEFAKYGTALYELEVVERTLNDYIDGFRREDLKEGEKAAQLGRSIEVMTHLASLYIGNELADQSDNLLMRALCLQSQLESATSALTITKSMLEHNLPTDGEDSEDQDESVSDSIMILSRLRTIMDLVRNARVVSGKTQRALAELQARSLTLEESFTEDFVHAETVASEIAIYNCRAGQDLQNIFAEEGRAEPYSPSEVASILSRVGMSVFSLSTPEAGPYNALASRLHDLESLLANVAALPTDLDNTVEFERAPAPWAARSEELKQTKISSVNTEAELSRTLESVRERDGQLKQKETELEEQSVRIEMLEARLKDASKRSARIAELERALHEAKDGEKHAKNDLARARQAAQQDVDRVRQEMARISEDSRQNGEIKALETDAMGAGTRITMKRQEHKIAGLENAIRFLRDENHRLYLPPPDAPRAISQSIDWLHAPLAKPSITERRAEQNVLRREGEKVLEQLLQFTSRPHPVDLTQMPENKLAWRPAKHSSRWQIEQRNEEWVDWKEWRHELIQKARASPSRTLSAAIES